MPPNSDFARRVNYTYIVDEKTYEGQMNWVDLRRKPEIRTGAKIRVYYQVEDPTFSRTEDEPTTEVWVWLGMVLATVMWGVVFTIAYRPRKRPAI